MIIPDPVSGKPLAADGETKPLNSYWIRRLSDADQGFGGVVKATAPEPAGQPANESTAQPTGGKPTGGKEGGK